MSRDLREEILTVENAGERIHGMLHLPDQAHGPVPAVMLLHGFGGSSSSDNRILVRQARCLSEVGMAALRFDFRGSGQSEGEFSEMTLSGEMSDSLLMYDVLSRHPEVDHRRLGVLGLSMGGAIAASIVGQCENLRAAVLWAPVAHPYDLLMRYAAATGREPDPESGYADARGEAVGPAFMMELPLILPLEGVVGTEVPLLVIHGSADATVPMAEGEAYVEAAAGVRRFSAIAGADHTFQALPWRARLYAETTGWFERYL